jgi:coxsackievirus/adenovirus receptor
MKMKKTLFLLLLLLTLAACSQTDPVPTQPCGTTFNPVCGIDNITYRNECLAKEANAEIQNQGTCVEAMEAINCPNGFAPVCGVDNKQYGTSCLAQARNVAVLFVGNCNQTQTEAIGPNRCADVAGFICASNGMTFQNECLAKSYGLTRVSDGPCT